MNIATYERLLLSAVLREKVAIYRLAPEIPDTSFWYGPGDVEAPAHSLIYKSMVALYQDQDPIDVGTLGKRLGKDLDLIGGEAYLVQLANTLPTLGIHNIEGLTEWASVVDGAGRLRRLSHVLTKYQDQLNDIDKALPRIGDVDGFFADVMEDIGDTSKALTSYQHISVAGAEFQRELDSEMGGAAVSWLPIGWQATRKYNILPRASLVTLLGIPSSGKSQLLAQFVLGAAIQLKHYNLPGVCVINTYEMKGKKYLGRMASCLSGVNLKSPQLKDSSTEEYHRLIQAKEFVETLPILYDDVGDMTSTQIVTQTLALAAEHGQVHIVGVDYVELVPDQDKGSEELRISNIFRQGQRLSRKIDGACVWLSQPSGLDQDTMLAGPGGTRYARMGGWAAAELQMELYNPIYMKAQGMSFRKPDILPSLDKAYVFVHKNKHGPTGFFALEWTPGIVRFADPAMAGFGMDALYDNLRELWSVEDF